MKITLEQLRDLQKIPNKSKVKYSGNFEVEMEILMKKVEKAVKKEIVSKYRVEYMNFGKNNMKIKINDKEKLIEKLISGNFTYNHTDERYGYVDPQFLVNELGQKTKVFSMGKFSILDNENIVNKFIKSLISIIEQY